MTLLATIRRELAAAGDPARAPQMQAYMKSAMPYHGVSSKLVREITRRVFADLTIERTASWRREVLALWRGARFREERYAAISLLGDRRVRAFHTMESLPMLEEMIVTGAWWDYVDTIAANHVGKILKSEPVPASRMMRAWSKDEDMWKRRTSILCQLRFKSDIDLGLLYDCIEPSIGSKEFFLRKAIGWALRQHAWTDAREVARYVEANRTRLSGLSIREALKNVPPSAPSSATSSPARAARRKKTSAGPRTRSRAPRA